jgi:Rps23 Pro-64 3,4-dihydroxylase Tpa1-like proline 4-hydroxylase
LVQLEHSDRMRALLGLFCLASLRGGPALADGGAAGTPLQEPANPSNPSNPSNPYSAIPPPPRDEHFYNRIVDELRGVYLQARPFRHVIADGIFPADLVRQVASEFLHIDQNSVVLPDGYAISNHKVQYNKIEQLAISVKPATRFLMDHMKSKAFVDFLSAVTGIPKLVPDPTDTGAGPHQIVRGGLLKIHLDFNFNERISLWRRVNVLFYLNEGWDVGWGGALELWSGVGGGGGGGTDTSDTGMGQLEGEVQPLFNRMVIFEATEGSYHGHPDALHCPSNVTRKSVAMYYYSAESASESAERERAERVEREAEGGERERGKGGEAAMDGEKGEGGARATPPIPPIRPRQTDFRPRAEDSFNRANMYERN